jgi:hypothetical protein
MKNNARQKSVLKKIAAAAILSGMFFSVSGSAEQKIPYTKETREIRCFPNEIFVGLMKDFKEVPIIISSDEEYLIIVWMNEKEKTITITESKGNNTCVMNIGFDAQFSTGKNI